MLLVSAPLGALPAPGADAYHQLRFGKSLFLPVARTAGLSRNIVIELGKVDSMVNGRQRTMQEIPKLTVIEPWECGWGYIGKNHPEAVGSGLEFAGEVS